MRARLLAPLIAVLALALPLAQGHVGGQSVSSAAPGISQDTRSHVPDAALVHLVGHGGHAESSLQTQAAAPEQAALELAPQTGLREAEAGAERLGASVRPSWSLRGPPAL